MSKYTVEAIHGCKIITGVVPLQDMASLMASAPTGALMDMQLAERIGATLVFGLADDLAKLRAAGLPPSKASQWQIESARDAGLGESAVAWVAEGDRGRSSDTLFSVLTGVALLEAGDYSAPRDLADLARCRKLLDAVPEHETKVTNIEVARLGPLANPPS